MKAPALYCAPSRSDAFRTKEESQANFDQWCDRDVNDRLFQALCDRTLAEQNKSPKISPFQRLAQVVAKTALGAISFNTTLASPKEDTEEAILIDNWPTKIKLPKGADVLS